MPINPYTEYEASQREASRPTVRNAAPQFATPAPPPGGGTTQSFVDAFRATTIEGAAQIQQQTSQALLAGTQDTTAQRQQAQDRLRFGLQGIGLDREALGVRREEAALDRRDMLEAAVNNALQRGIYNSGIRIRDVARADERSDLVDKQLDITGKRLNLNASELRASVKNALAALSQQTKAARQQAAAQADIARAQYVMQQQQALDQQILTNGPVYNDATYITSTRGLR